MGVAADHIPSVPVEVGLSYAVPSLCGDGVVVWKSHERKGLYRAPRIATAGSSDSITTRRHVPTGGVVGLHLKPGQKGTKHLVAQYGDRLVCVRYRYDAARKVVSRLRWK